MNADNADKPVIESDLRILRISAARFSYMWEVRTPKGKSENVKKGKSKYLICIIRVDSRVT